MRGNHSHLLHASRKPQENSITTRYELDPQFLLEPQFVCASSLLGNSENIHRIIQNIPKFPNSLHAPPKLGQKGQTSSKLPLRRHSQCQNIEWIAAKCLRHGPGAAKATVLPRRPRTPTLDNWEDMWRWYDSLYFTITNHYLFSSFFLHSSNPNFFGKLITGLGTSVIECSYFIRCRGMERCAGASAWFRVRPVLERLPRLPPLFAAGWRQTVVQFWLRLSATKAAIISRPLVNGFWWHGSEM